MTMGNNNDDHILAEAIGYAAGYKLGQHWANKQMEREERRVRKAQELAEWDARMALKAAEADHEWERWKQEQQQEKLKAEQHDRKEAERMGITYEEYTRIGNIGMIVGMIISGILGVILLVAAGDLIFQFIIRPFIAGLTGTTYML